MKKLISATVSLLTSASMIAGAGILPAFADSVQESETYVIEDFLDYGCYNTFSVLSNFNDDSYAFRDLLDENNLAVYNALSVLTTPTEKSITIKLPKSVNVTLESSDISNLTENDRQNIENAVASAFKTGIDALLLDFPEIFWLDESKCNIQYGYNTSRDWFKGTYTLSVSTIVFTPHYLDSYDSLDGVKEYGQKLSEAVENFNAEGKSRYEKIKSIHDQISLFTYYDINANFYNCAVGALVEPGVVCEGYSKAFKLICDREEIPCICVVGNYEEEKRTAHMWNYVKMEDGKWYGIDVTWDDIDGYGGEEIKYDYFLAGSDSFNKKHTSGTAISSLVYPTISETDYIWNPQTETTTTNTTTSTTTTTTTTTTSETTRTTATTATTSAAPTTSITSTSLTSLPVTTTASATSSKTESAETSTSSATSKPKTSTTTTLTQTSTTETSSETTTTTTTQTTAPTYKRGDLNHDGKIRISDLVYCEKAIFGKKELNDECDVNMDGKFNVYDMTELRKLVIYYVY